MSTIFIFNHVFLDTLCLEAPTSTAASRNLALKVEYISLTRDVGHFQGKCVVTDATECRVVSF